MGTDSKKAWITGAMLIALAASAEAQTTTLVSVDSAGVPGNSLSHAQSISSTGRFAVFASLATNLVPGDGNGVFDVFVHDRVTGQTTRASVDSSGAEGNGDSGGQSERAAISADGRIVAFSSWATNLVAGDDNGFRDVFVHDFLTGETKCVSVDPSGSPSTTGFSWDPALSDDGRFVAFASSADDLAPGSSTTFDNVLVRDLATRWYAVYYRDPHVLGGCPAAGTFNITQTQRVQWDA